ncbi:arylacetamide deacetylase-like [Diadema antillarum]|uniref:arylacetamide deacetylase-like n=1 Tax=Diadema antillarum TaxID=105358 RepID=UPI003A88A1BC
MKTKTILFVFLVLGIAFAYVLYKPVPDGFPEPWKYRATVTAAQTISLLNTMRMCARDIRCPNAFEEAREFFRIMSTLVQQPPSEVPGSNIRSRLDTFGGVRVRVYEPKVRGREEPLPAFIFFHGGGLAMGSIEFYDPAVRMISERLGIVGVAVGYRLAPAHTFPAAHDDAITATKWLLTHAKEMAVDPRRVAVIGDSAGGHLAAVVSAAIADDATLPDIKLQVLLYPWLQSLDLNTPSIQKMRCNAFHGPMPVLELAPYFTTAYTLGYTDDDNDIGRQIYANNHTSAEFKQSAAYQKYFNHDLVPADMKIDCYKRSLSFDFGNDDLWRSLKSIWMSEKFSPLLRDDMSSLPRTFVATFGYDYLRDDGIFYVERLKAAGVPVRWENYELGYHAIQWFGDVTFEIGRQMADDFVSYIREYLWSE